MYVLDCRLPGSPRAASWECYRYSEAEKRMDLSTSEAEQAVCELERADGFDYEFTKGSRKARPGCEEACACCRRKLDRGVSEAYGSGDRPSPENHRYRAEANSRGQLVALVSRDTLGDIDEGQHCYYRIAVVSHRLAPVAIRIRGFDWHQGTALPIGEPLEGVVDGRHSFSYALDSPATEGSGSSADGYVALSLEACSGNLKLQTAPHGPFGGSSLSLQGSVTPTRVSVQKNRWVQVSAADAGSGSCSYVLSAEDPATLVWLEPTPLRSLHAELSGTSVTLTWAPAKLFGNGHPAGGSGGDGDPVVEYEVFYLPASRTPPSLREVQSNLSAACGLYLEHRHRRARRFATKTERRLTIKDMEPGRSYVFNVVARSIMTGHSTAYLPVRKFIATPSATFRESGNFGQLLSFSWENNIPYFIFFLAAFLALYYRPWKRLTSRGIFELELSRRPGRGHVAAESGSYLPPSIVGAGEGVATQYQYGQLR